MQSDWRTNEDCNKIWVLILYEKKREDSFLMILAICSFIVTRIRSIGKRYVDLMIIHLFSIFVNLLIECILILLKITDNIYYNLSHLYIIKLIYTIKLRSTGHWKGRCARQKKYVLPYSYRKFSTTIILLQRKLRHGFTTNFSITYTFCCSVKYMNNNVYIINSDNHNNGNNSNNKTW